MSNFLEIKIHDKIYIQRKEFGKIQEFTLDGTKLNTYEELPTAIQKIINLSLAMEQNPDNFFEYEEISEGIRINLVKDNYDIENFIKIPDKINGKPVVELGSLVVARTMYDRIEQIQLPDTIQKFAGRCFSMMHNLKLVNAPNDLRIMNDRCFEDCRALMEFDTSKVAHVGIACFRNCNNIKELDFSNAKISAEAVFGCIKLHTLKLPENLTYIPGHFAYNCRVLTNINLCDSIKRIYDSAFFNCKSFNPEKMPNELLEIKNGAFQKSGIKKFIAPKKLEKIGFAAFFQSELEQVVVGKNVSIDREVFSGCDNLKEMKIYKNIKNKEIDDTER